MPVWVEKLLIEIIGKYVAPIIVELVKKYLTTQQLAELIKQAGTALICWAKGQVTNTDNKIDDAFVQILADALGVDPSTCPVPPKGP